MFLNIPHTKNTTNKNKTIQTLQSQQQSQSYFFPHRKVDKLTLLELGIPEDIQLKQEEQWELAYILYQILGYASLREADIHHHANRLGQYDIANYTSGGSNGDCNKVKNQQNSSSSNVNKQYCKCCGFTKQNTTIPLCTNFQQFPTIGISTYLFFQTIKNIIYLFLLLTLTISAYSFSTNFYLFSNKYNLQQLITNNSITIILNTIIQSISLGIKKQQNTDQSRLFYMIQMWIGVGIVLIWSFLLFIIKYMLYKKSVMIDNATISAADFSIIIQNYPINISKQQLQQQFNKYYQDKLSVKQSHHSHHHGNNQCIFKIQKINLHKQLQVNKQQQLQLEEINKMYQQQIVEVIQWVIDFIDNGYKFKKINNNINHNNNKLKDLDLDVNQKQRIQKYEKIQNLKNKRNKKGKQILSALLMLKEDNSNGIGSFLNIANNQSNIDENNNSQHVEKSQQKINTTFAVITFKYSNSKDIFIKYNQMGVIDNIRYYLSCCMNKNNFKLYKNNDNNSCNNNADNSNNNNKQYPSLIIYKAPQPQDILWQNLSKKLYQKIFRKLGTYIVTIILLGVSFGCVYILTVQQLNNQDNFYLSIIISLTIALINVSISFLIAFLTNFQGNHTETGHQSSLAIKSIFAQLINSIFVPIIANYLIEDRNIYGKNGLSTNIIYLAITNSLLLPILRMLVDFNYRYFTIKAYYLKNTLKSRLKMKQSQLNTKLQLPTFQIGYQYIYFINLYLFTCFYISLQPIICVIAIIGMISTYWVLKYCLLKRLQRPVPGTDMISDIMGQYIAIGPIFYQLGALTWSHFLYQYQQVQQQTIFYIPNLVGVGIGVLFYIFPFSLILGSCLEKQQQQNNQYQNLQYQQSRILLNSQYDRVNPATSQTAIKQYQQYIQEYMRKLKNNNNNNQNKLNRTHNNKNILYPNIVTDYDQLYEGNTLKTQENLMNNNNINNYNINNNTNDDEKNKQQQSHTNLNNNTNSNNNTNKLSQINNQYLVMKQAILKSNANKQTPNKLMNILTQCNNLSKQILTSLFIPNKDANKDTNNNNRSSLLQSKQDKNKKKQQSSIKQIRQQKQIKQQKHNIVQNQKQIQKNQRSIMDELQPYNSNNYNISIKDNQNNNDNQNNSDNNYLSNISKNNNRSYFTNRSSNVRGLQYTAKKIDYNRNHKFNSQIQRYTNDNDHNNSKFQSSFSFPHQSILEQQQNNDNNNQRQYTSMNINSNNDNDSKNNKIDHAKYFGANNNRMVKNRKKTRNGGERKNPYDSIF